MTEPIPISAADARRWADGVKRRPLLTSFSGNANPYSIEPVMPLVTFPPCPECSRSVRQVAFYSDDPNRFGLRPCRHEFAVQPEDEPVHEIRWPGGQVTDLRGGANPLSAASVLDAEAFRRLLTGAVVDPTAEVMRQRYAPFRGAYDAAFADWERLMDALGLPDPMGAYAVLNIHYPQISERLLRVGCIHCGVAWPCAPFAALNESWRP